MASDLKALLTKLVETQEQQNAKLDRLAALLLSHQLLMECVDHHGHSREADLVQELVSESYSAGLCLLNGLDQRNKQYQYQVSEFFIDDPEPGDDTVQDLANPF